MRQFYVTEGDTSSKKEKIAYPKLALCLSALAAMW